MVEGLAPPTRAVVHLHDTICRRLRIQTRILFVCKENKNNDYIQQFVSSRHRSAILKNIHWTHIAYAVT